MRNDGRESRQERRRRQAKFFLMEHRKGKAHVYQRLIVLAVLTATFFVVLL